MPSVYPLTIPSSHRMIKIIAMVSSIRSSPPLPLGALLRGKKCNLSAAICTGLCAVLLSCAPRPAAAQNAAEIAKFLTGGAIGLGLHEFGHVVANVASGSTPGIRGVRFGPIPFFAITHEPVSPARAFTIASAGFWMQQASSEWILSQRPRLRDEPAPLLKGLLAFNVLASAAYAGAAFGGFGPLERDTRGMAISAGIREPWIGAWILAPAVVDAARYYTADSAWLRWTSRAVKVGGVLLVVKAAG